MIETPALISIGWANGGYILAVLIEDSEGMIGQETFVTSSLENLMSLVRDHAEAIDRARRELEPIGE